MIGGVQHCLARNASYAKLALFILILHQNSNVLVVRRESREVMQIFIVNKRWDCVVMRNDRYRVR